MNYPKVSIVIASYNSEVTLGKVLLSIRQQSYQAGKLEILVIDGGSTDNTVKIAKKFNAKIYKNPKRDQVYGKFIGYKNANGKYLLLIDSDEVLENKDSIKFKVESMMKDSSVHVSVSSGLKKPTEYSDINYYLNEFGDPFSYFLYRNSKDPDFFLKQLKNEYKLIYEDKRRAVFDFSLSSNPPFIELTAMAVLIDLKYIRTNLPEIFKAAATHTHLFYLINTKGNLFAIMKDDPVIHYSVAIMSGYLRKIRSRVTSNVYKNDMGLAGFSGRSNYQSSWYKIKKYLFLIYAATIIFPIIDSLYLSFTRKKIVYLLHAFFTYYTFCLIIFFYGCKIMNIKTKTYNYGGK